MHCPFIFNMKTRNGVFYDLNHSTYKHRVPDTKMTFVFSSDLHMFKFEDQYLKYRDEFNTKLKARYRVDIMATVLPDIILYIKIETRGFLVINEKGEIICRENLKLIGEKATPKN